jgi:hypothetical protein
VQRTFAPRQCVECHLIGDFQNIQRERDGALDKLTHLYRSPDIKTLGIELDVPKGLVVKEATGAAKAAGMQAGDRIVAWEGTRVLTFGDLQYRYDKVDRNATKVTVQVERGATLETRSRSRSPTAGGGPISASASPASIRASISRTARSPRKRKASSAYPPTASPAR